jgi:hypothetical protein
MTDYRQIEWIIGMQDKSFNIKPPKHTDISLKRTPPRTMTEAEEKHYAIHKNLNGFYKR